MAPQSFLFSACGSVFLGGGQLARRTPLNETPNRVLLSCACREGSQGLTSPSPESDPSFYMDTFVYVHADAVSILCGQVPPPGRF